MEGFFCPPSGEIERTISRRENLALARVAGALARERVPEESATRIDSAGPLEVDNDQAEVEGMTAMLDKDAVAHAHLKTPKAAAIAGIVFSLLMFGIFGLLRRSIPADPLETGNWLAADTGMIKLALNLVPIAGVAFLWFIGVLRDRLGAREDRFFATVFLGSGLLFLAMLFLGAAMIGAVTLIASAAEPNDLTSSATFRFARAGAFIIANVYASKMAAVFMFSTSTVVIYTGIAPGWMAYIGFLLALIVLVASQNIGWSLAVLPVWVLLISGYILVDNLAGVRSPT